MLGLRLVPIASLIEPLTGVERAAHVRNKWEWYEAKPLQPSALKPSALKPKDEALTEVGKSIVEIVI